MESCIPWFLRLRAGVDVAVAGVAEPQADEAAPVVALRQHQAERQRVKRDSSPADPRQRL
jgi:hypothetical protein